MTHFASSHKQKRTTRNLKTQNNQNCQKIKLYGSLITTDLKKKHSFRLVEGVETAARKERTGSKVMVADQEVLLLCPDNQEE